MESTDTASAAFVVALILVIFLFLVTVDNSSSRWNGVNQDPGVTTAMLVLLIACASLVFLSVCMCWLCSMFGKNSDESGYDDSMETLCRCL
jgi:hypothetical protein